MIEEEWLGDIPLYRLPALWPNASDHRLHQLSRKLRLISIALRVPGGPFPDLADGELIHAQLANAEDGKLSAGLIDRAEREEQRCLHREWDLRPGSRPYWEEPTGEELQMRKEARFWALVRVWPSLIRHVSIWAEWAQTRHHQSGQLVSDLCREVFGNPFQPVRFQPQWRTGDTSGLARGIYEDRAFDRMPLLADALMDASCDDDQIISHCQSAGPHVRGCWVVDLVLGKQ